MASVAVDMLATMEQSVHRGPMGILPIQCRWDPEGPLVSRRTGFSDMVSDDGYDTKDSGNKGSCPARLNRQADIYFRVNPSDTRVAARQSLRNRSDWKYVVHKCRNVRKRYITAEYMS